MNELAGKHLLVVGTGGVKRRPVLEALRALGLRRVTCLHDRPNWAAPLVDEWIEADSVTWSPATLDLVRSRVRDLDGVLTYDDYSVVVAAQLADALGHIGISPETAKRAKNKPAMRSLCRERGLPAPRFAQLDPWSDDVASALARERISFPVVAKPSHGAGSVLVRRADDLGELERTLRAYREAIPNEAAAALWPDTTVLIEEYLAGAEVDIDMLVQGGEVKYAAVTDNFAPREPYFMELGGQIPSALPDRAQRELVRVAGEVLAALGVRDCCVHFEARWTERGAVPIEANLRLGGAEVYAFNRGAHGVDLVEGAVRIALGLPVARHDSSIPPRHFLRSANLVPPCSGRLDSVTVEPGLARDDGFAELVLFREVGSELRVPPEGFDYLGWLVVKGESRAAADAKMRALAPKIRFEIGTTSFHGAFLESVS